MDVNSIVYQGAGHSWENLAPQALKEDAPYISGCEVTYDEKGYPLLNGENILKLSDQPTREERIASRLKSGPKYKDCLKYGYLIGNDDETKQQAYSDLLNFLTHVTHSASIEVPGTMISVRRGKALLSAQSGSN